MGATLCFIALLLGSGAGARQEDPSFHVVTCEYHNRPIKAVLTDLFAKVSLYFSMDPKIQGNLSAHLKPMPWEYALQTILAGCDLNYRSEGGQFEIVQRERTADEQRSIDANPIVAIQTIGLPNLSAPPLRLRKADLAETFWRVLTKAGEHFVLGIGIAGSVTADLPAQPLAKTIASLALQGRCGVKYKAKVWTISGPYRGP